jgi:hypothetical protein
MPITKEMVEEALSLSEEFPDDTEIVEGALSIASAYENEQRKRRLTTREYFVDREKHGLSDDEITKIAKIYNGDTDQKYRLFNKQFFRDFGGLTDEQIDALGPSLKKQYSLKYWGEEVVEEKAFWERQGQEFEFQEEISVKGQDLAMSGAKSWEADAAFDFDYVEDPRYKGREEAMRQEFRNAYQGVKNEIAGLEPVADVFVNQLKITMGVGDAGGKKALPDKWFLDTVMDIEPEKRDLFLSMVAARGGEGEQKRIFQAMGEAMGRSATDMVTNFKAETRLRKLDALARHVAANGAVSGIPADFGFDVDPHLGGYIGSREASDRADKVKAPALGSEEFKSLSAEQQVELKRIYEEQDFTKLYKKINDIATGVIDPAKGSNWYSSFAIGAARMVPNLAMMAAGPVGVAVNARTYISQRTLDHAIENPGVDYRDSQAIGTAQGIGEGLLDLVPMKVLTGRAPLLSKWLAKPTLTKSGLVGRFAARGVAGIAVEGAAEFGQEVVIPSAVEELAQMLKAELPDANWDARLEGFTSEESLAELIPVIVGFSLIGQGVGSIRDYKNGLGLVRNRNLLIGAKLTEAEADAVVEAAQRDDVETAQDLLRKAFTRIDEKREISGVMPEASRQALKNVQAEIDRRIEAEAKGEISGIIPKYGRSADGHYLRFQDGSTRSYSSRAEADRARWEYAEEKRLNELDQFRSAISMVERGAKVGEEFDFEFENRRDDLRQARERGETSAAGAVNRIDQADRMGGQKVARQEIDTGEVDIESEYQDHFTATELQANSLDDMLASYQILGSNRIEYAEEITRFVIRLKQGATPLTVFEEKIEGDAKIMLDDKTGAGRKWLLSRLRGYERASGEKLLPAKDEDVTNNDLREGYSHFGMSYLVGRTRKSERGENFVDPGRKQIAEMMRRARVAGLAVAGEGYTEFFREVMKRAARINKLRREGALDADLEREIARSVGFGEQAEYEAGVETEAQALLREMDEAGFDRALPESSGFEPTDDAPFSVIGGLGERREAMSLPDAVSWLSKEKSGIAVGVLSFQGRAISLVWGSPGEKKGAGFGLSKIIAWHPEVDPLQLQEILDRMEIAKETENTISLKGDDFQAVIRRNVFGEDHEWLLTAYGKNVPARERIDGSGAKSQSRQTLPEKDAKQKSQNSEEESSFSVIRTSSSDGQSVTTENPVLTSIAGVSAADIFQSAKKRHGVTRSIYEAGYVLPDGTLLDFSGRADAGGFKQLKDLTFVAESGRDYMRDQRSVDHREIEWEGMPQAREQSDGMLDFLRLGAIRIDANSGMISMHSRAKPSGAQLSVLKALVVGADGAYMDLEDDSGARASIQLEGGKFAKVQGLINRWVSGENPEYEGTSFSVVRILDIKDGVGDPAANLRKKLNRKPNTGVAKNPALRVEVDGKALWIGANQKQGGKPFKAWVEETEAWYSDEEIAAAAAWYGELKSMFEAEFGKDAPKMMLAWLSGQQNESPGGAVRNVYRVKDRIAGLLHGKKGGLADEKLQAIFSDSVPEGGYGPKLADFVDAGMGKSTRTFMGDDPLGGMPFVADVHTGRDSGHVDQQTLTRLKNAAETGRLTVGGKKATVNVTKSKTLMEKGEAKEVPEEIVIQVGGKEILVKRDMSGSPGDNVYEGISEWGKGLTDYLNKIGWKGRRDWLPTQVQAVGWMRILRQYGLKESTLASSLDENTHRISAEVDYGLSATLRQIYPDFAALDEITRTAITKTVMGKAIRDIVKIVAPHVTFRGVDFGQGYWEGSAAPAAQFWILGSPEAAGLVEVALAHATEQAGTARVRFGVGGKNSRAIILPTMDAETSRQFIEFVEATKKSSDKAAASDAKAIMGASTQVMPGQGGLVMFGLSESGARRTIATVERFAEANGIDVDINDLAAEASFSGNDWSADPEGQSYRDAFEQRGGSAQVWNNVLHYRGQYAEHLEDAFEQHAPGNLDPAGRKERVKAYASERTDASFSVITNAESRIAEAFNPYLRNPEQRRKIVLEAQRRAAEQARTFQEIIRFNRSGADIERERKQRADELFTEKLEGLSSAEVGALGIEEVLADPGFQPILSDLLRRVESKTKSGKTIKYWKGSLMSKSAAKRAGIDTRGGEWDSIPEGLPPYVWGGTLTPDEATDMFNFERPEDFWDAVSAEILSLRQRKSDVSKANARVREIEREAVAESRVWAEEQQKLRRSVGTDRATLIAAMRTLDAMISALPSEIRGKIGGFVRLAQFKTPGAMLDELERRANRLDVVLERWLKQEADKGVAALFERAKPAKDESGKKRVGKAGADIHDLFDTARMAWKTWTAEKAEAHAVGLDALVAKGELSPEEEAHALLEAELVRSFGGWNEADSVRKNHALDAATEIWTRGYLEYREKKAKEKERRDGIRAELRADTGKVGTKSERALEEMAGVKLPGRSRDFFLSLLSFAQLTQWAFGKESKWAQWFADEQRKAENAKLDAVQAVTEGVENLFTDLAGGSRFKGEQLQFRMMKQSLEATAANGDVVPLSELKAISALLMWQQEDGKRHLRGKRDENGNVVSTWAYDENFIDEISGKLSPEAWRVLGYLQAEYGKEYGPLNAVYRDIYGINLPQNSNYSPLTVKPQQAAAGQTEDPLTGSTVSTGSFTPGSLRSRAQVSAEPDFRDAVATFIAHKKQIEHWKAHARFVLDANAVLGNREVGNSVEAAHGQEAVKLIRKWLDAIAQGGVRDASAGTAIRGFFDRITGNAASMALVGRVGTLAIQATQLGAGAALMPTGAYVIRLGKLLSGNLSWGAALDSAYIKRRLAQQPVMVQAAMEGLKAGKPTQIKHQVRKLGSLLNGADALFTSGTYAIAYDYHFSQARKGGMDEAGAAAYATETAERVMESVAQPTRMGTRSFLEVSSSNPFMRLAWAFASDARKNAGLMGYAYAKGNLVDKYRATLFVVLLGGLLAGVIRSAWRDARDGEDDELFDEKYWNPKRLALSTSTDWLVGFPVIGEEVQRAIMNAAGEYTPDGGLLSALSQAPGAAANIIQGDSTDYLRDIEKIMSAIGLLSDNTAAATSVMHLVRDIYGLTENFTPQ